VKGFRHRLRAGQATTSIWHKEVRLWALRLRRLWQGLAQDHTYKTCTNTILPV